jgi:hypothetical protein
VGRIRILGNKDALKELEKVPFISLFAKLCLEGYTKEACKIVLDEKKKKFLMK